jgi:hypothetical protein|tara:strand:- start:965 stop:1219 length:255 start_codon:yes stop_codon:yes gene_type:complete
MQSYDDKLHTHGAEYIVGLNDGTVLKDIIFEGYKMFNGKQIMCFRTKDKDSVVTINPSYHSFTIENSDLEMNEVLYREMNQIKQ